MGKKFLRYEFLIVYHIFEKFIYRITDGKMEGLLCVDKTELTCYQLFIEFKVKELEREL